MKKVFYLATFFLMGCLFVRSAGAAYIHDDQEPNAANNRNVHITFGVNNNVFPAGNVRNNAQQLLRMEAFSDATDALKASKAIQQNIVFNIWSIQCPPANHGAAFQTFLGGTPDEWQLQTSRINYLEEKGFIEEFDALCQKLYGGHFTLNRHNY